MQDNRKFITPAKETGLAATEHMERSLRWSLRFAGVSCIGNTIIGLGKLTLGIFSLSFFTCANALFTFGMVIAKLCALAGIVKADTIKKQYQYYKLSGVILIISSLLYILYSLRLFIYPVTSEYHMYAALGIAAFTFTEITINIRGVIVYRHDHTLLVNAIKKINLAASLICLVLTQAAILSFTEPGSEGIALNNAQIGVIMGCLASILGVTMIIRAHKTR